jgi:ParB-like chromosome segregation protein Spo0J
MDLSLDQISVGNRRRRDLGDIEALMVSICDRGLLQPLVITPDRWLVSGYRRLEASRRLGYSRIKVTVASGLTEALELLLAERTEKTCCKPFTPSEAVEMAKVIKQLEHNRATELQARPGLELSRILRILGKGRTRDKMAQVFSDMSGQTLRKAEAVVTAAEASPSLSPIREEMDRTGKVDPAYKAVLKRLAKTSTTGRKALMPTGRCRQRDGIRPATFVGGVDVSDQVRDRESHVARWQHPVFQLFQVEPQAMV